MATDTSAIMQLNYLSSSNLSLTYPAKCIHIHVWLQIFHPRSVGSIKENSKHAIHKKRQFAQQNVHFEEVCDILELKDKEIGSTVVSFHVHRIAQSSSRAAANGYCPLK